MFVSLDLGASFIHTIPPVSSIIYSHERYSVFMTCISRGVVYYSWIKAAPCGHYRPIKERFFSESMHMKEIQNPSFTLLSKQCQFAQTHILKRFHNK